MQATEATTAPTKVIYGVNELDLDLAGNTVRGIWQALSEVLNIPRDAVCRSTANGQTTSTSSTRATRSSSRSRGA